MKINLRVLPAVLIFAFVLTHQITVQAVVGSPLKAPAAQSIADLSTEDILNLDKKELVQKMNRSLTWKEKMAINWIKRKAKKNTKANKADHDKHREYARTSGMAVAGFVTGILGILGGVTLVFAILGIVLSATALKRMRRNPDLGGRGLAIAGLVMGIVACVVFTGVLALALAFA